MAWAARNVRRLVGTAFAYVRPDASSMKRCPKFGSCSAPICPLDKGWSQRSMGKGEAVCIWFREMAKQGPEAQGVPGDIRHEVAEVLPQAIERPGLAPLRASLKRAAKSASKRGTLQ